MGKAMAGPRLGNPCPCPPAGPARQRHDHTKCCSGQPILMDTGYDPGAPTRRPAKRLPRSSRSPGRETVAAAARAGKYTSRPYIHEAGGGHVWRIERQGSEADRRRDHRYEVERLKAAAASSMQLQAA